MTRHPHLRLVDGRYGQHVTLPRTVVVEAAMNANSLDAPQASALLGPGLFGVPATRR